MLAVLAGRYVPRLSIMFHHQSVCFQAGFCALILVLPSNGPYRYSLPIWWSSNRSTFGQMDDGQPDCGFLSLYVGVPAYDVFLMTVANSLILCYGEQGCAGVWYDHDNERILIVMFFATDRWSIGGKMPCWLALLCLLHWWLIVRPQLVILKRCICLSDSCWW